MTDRARKKTVSIQKLHQPKIPITIVFPLITLRHRVRMSCLILRHMRVTRRMKSSEIRYPMTSFGVPLPATSCACLRPMTSCGVPRRMTSCGILNPTQSCRVPWSTSSRIAISISTGYPLLLTRRSNTGSLRGKPRENAIRRNVSSPYRTWTRWTISWLGRQRL